MVRKRTAARKRTVVIALLGVVVVGGTAALALNGANGADDEAEDAAAGTTAPVEVRDLAREETMGGVLGYRDQRELAVQRSGTVTRLPDVGATVESGEELLRVEEEPVVLLAGGDVPAWRDLEPGMSNGVDVKQLEQALLDLGYGEESDSFPDRSWDWRTTEALRKFQDDTGLDVDGGLGLGEFVFADTDLRIDGHLADAGDALQPGQGTMTVSSSERLVTLDLDPADRDLVSEEMAVEVDLPTGATVEGEVASVGTTLESGPDGDGETLEVEITLDDDEPAAGLDQAPVVVSIATTVADDVTAVPVAALVAVADGGYAVTVVAEDGTREQVPVEPGAWGDSHVEVDGEIAEGDQVEVPR
jgi:peptidoglycan hydrolase-like protein with peptidoglycan-binding domain